MSKKILFLVICSLCLVFAVWALRGITQGKQSLGNREVTANVNVALLNESDSRQTMSNVQAQVKNGVVNLNGTTVTKEEKKAIEKKVSTSAGVEQVINNIKITGSEPIEP